MKAEAPEISKKGVNTMEAMGKSETSDQPREHHERREETINEKMSHEIQEINSAIYLTILEEVSTLEKEEEFIIGESKMDMDCLTEEE
ncbi:17710_t:CDS:2 [Acaulospora morrowiae]|uniref:17710_t:CDS:1 n=1 Tax=Acaulospora morrowiae TaxID=94023 RepID=A0A9N9DUA2_9GLOM|nr:17710_t:CDS:2 [Acaulospora morrowiae]